MSTEVTSHTGSAASWPPATAPADPGAAPLDERFHALVRDRIETLVRRYPVWATFLGIHSEDGRLGDGSRDAVEQGIEDERRFIAQIQALDVAQLSEPVRFERELALHGARRSLFDDDVHRTWERRVTAMDELGDGIFLILARDFAPLGERLESMTSRLEAGPRVMEEHKTRLGPRPMRLWNEMELEAVASMPGLFDELAAAARSVWDDDSREMQRLSAAITDAKAAMADYSRWIGERLADAADDFPLGPERYDELVGLRGFDGLDTADILEIGEQQLATNKAARRNVARRIDPGASEAEVLARVKAHHPPTFDAALDGYRDAMLRARQHVLDRDLVTLPQGERLDVVPTPTYLRNVMPFAAYFQPARFDPDPTGIYVVTPSVGGNGRAMLEHNYASISNTSIHEAYPGHHVQLSAAITHPSLTRLLVDAPEFVEGWGMYSEQMMREEGFDDSPEHLLIMYTDAIWRSCRIILDVRMHRGEVTVPDAVDFLVEHTGFERPNATAEVNRYTYTPTYQLSYLLGKVLLLRLRDDERRRLGSEFSLRRFHDSLVYSGSVPISFHRRLLQGEGQPARG